MGWSRRRSRLSHLPRPRPAHVLGFSIGAQIALQLALDMAPLVRRWC
jgi:pimeloyl-ACP methyl ester carboxylesterase